jgi:hypothetical protein
MTVPATNEHEGSHSAGIEDLTCLSKGAMVTVIVAGPDTDAGPGRGFDHLVKFRGVPRTWFFNQDVLAGPRRGGPDLRQHVVGCRYHHDRYVGAVENGTPVRTWLRPMALGSKSSRPAGIHIAAHGSYAALGKRVSSFASDRATADDSEAYQFQLFSPASWTFARALSQSSIIVQRFAADQIPPAGEKGT